MADGSTIGLMLGSSVIGSFLTLGATAWKEAVSNTKSADYSALYLAMALEEYGRQCSDLLSESEMAFASEGMAGKAYGSLPKMPDSPSTVSWTALGIEITAEALALPVLVATTNVTIQSFWDIGEEEMAIGEIHDSAVEIGLQCFSLARSIREKRSIPPLVLNEKWNAFSHLIRKQEEYAAVKARSRESQSELFQDSDAHTETPTG